MTGNASVEVTDHLGLAPLDDDRLARSAGSLLLREARILDDREWVKWLELFTPDGLYWVPLDDSDDAGTGRALAIVHDDASGREARVFRLINTRVYDQDPVSQTVHAVSNVEVLGTDSRGDLVVESVQLVGEVRPGGAMQVGLNSTRQLMARVQHRLEVTDDGLRIRLKKVRLLDRSLGLYNLSFLL